jgi:putative hydrolase of the HAD superfamily
LFDAVGTLIHPDPPVTVAYQRAAHSLGLRIDEEQIRGRFSEAFARQEEFDRLHGRTTSPQREIERWREIVTEVFREAAPSPELCEQLFAHLWRHFARAKSWRVDPEAAACWEALTARGLIVAIASNFDDRLIEIAQQIPPLDRADRLFISARIGHRKPAAEFFRFIERDLEIALGDLLSVGDNPENDYEGAKSVGWQAILLDRQSQPNDATIASLSELPGRF